MFAWTDHSRKRSIERGLTRKQIEGVWTHEQAVKGPAGGEMSFISAPVVSGSKCRWVTLIHNHNSPPALVTVFFGVISLQKRKEAKALASVGDIEAMESSQADQPAAALPSSG
jgi:hypothetical protein